MSSRHQRANPVVERLRECRVAIHESWCPHRTGIKIGEGGLGALLLGMGLAHGISPAHVEEMESHHHHISHRVQTALRHNPHLLERHAQRHTSSHDLSLHNNLPIWGGAGLGSPISFSLAETVLSV